jgi:hypothetical protein
MHSLSAASLLFHTEPRTIFNASGRQRPHSHLEISASASAVSATRIIVYQGNLPNAAVNEFFAIGTHTHPVASSDAAWL